MHRWSLGRTILIGSRLHCFSSRIAAGEGPASYVWLDEASGRITWEAYKSRYLRNVQPAPEPLGDQIRRSARSIGTARGQQRRLVHGRYRVYTSRRLSLDVGDCMVEETNTLFQ